MTLLVTLILLYDALGNNIYAKKKKNLFCLFNKSLDFDLTIRTSYSAVIIAILLHPINERRNEIRVRRKINEEIP